MRARMLVLVLCTVGLGGCLVQSGVVLSGAALYSLTTTDKLPHDHLVSAATGADCSIVAFEQTGQYCPPELAVDRSDVYCYRTLGGVDCHLIPDPYRNGNRAIATPPPARVAVE